MGDTPETVMTTKAQTVLKKSHIVLETKVPKCIKWYKTQENHLFCLFFLLTLVTNITYVKVNII